MSSTPASPAKAVEPIFEAVLNEQGPETRTAVENIAGAKAAEAPRPVASTGTVAGRSSTGSGGASHKAPEIPPAG